MTDERSVYCWVIRTKERCGGIFRNKYTYSSLRTAPGNKRHLTALAYRVRLFTKKDDAEKYYFKKLNAGVPMQNCTVVRKKIFLDKKGKWDYWKNVEGFN